MKILFFSIITLFMTVESNGQNNNLPSASHIQGVYKIGSNTGFGSAFFYADQKHKYFITAKHLFPNVENGQMVNTNIFFEDKWSPLSAHIYIHDSAFVDIAVLVIDFMKGGSNPYNLKLDFRRTIGDDVFFLGFPLGLSTSDVGRMNIGFPIPLVKKGVFSGAQQVSNGIGISFLDGHNNPGFSGGPVIMMDYDSTHHMQLIGVVIAYVNQIDKISNDTVQLQYASNSGIVIVQDAKEIKYIIDKIK